nr:uncharacterized protein LOC105729291 [Aotus nancymaae]
MWNPRWAVLSWGPACPFPECSSAGQKVCPMSGCGPPDPILGCWGDIRAGPSPQFPLLAVPTGPPFSQVFSEVPRPWGHGKGVRYGWGAAPTAWSGIGPTAASLWASGGPGDSRGSAAPLLFYASPMSYDVSACRLPSVCVLVCYLGDGVFCMFSDKCVLPAQAPTTIKPHVCPTCALRVVPGLARAQCSSSPSSLFLPLTKHTACPSHVPVGRCTLLPRPERAHMMCSMHSPCPPQPAPQRTRWVAPGSLPPPTPARCAAVCVGVCFCVAGVSRDVAVFADMSPCPLLCFSVGF